MESHSLSEELINQMSGYMRIGADFMLASAACGIPEKIAKDWLLQSEQAGKEECEGIFLTLYESIRQSTAHAEVIALQRLSAEGGSAGAKWLLEKMKPEKYSATAKKEKPVFEAWSPGKS